MVEGPIDAEARARRPPEETLALWAIGLASANLLSLTLLTIYLVPPAVVLGVVAFGIARRGGRPTKLALVAIGIALVGPVLWLVWLL